VLYSQETAVVAVVRNDRVETRQIVVGLMAEGEAEIREGLTEGDLVVARAGAFFREGDRVRPFVAGAPAEQK
jgi:HlyD family secretion protein